MVPFPFNANHQPSIMGDFIWKRKLLRKQQAWKKVNKKSHHITFFYIQSPEDNKNSNTFNLKDIEKTTSTKTK